MSCDFQPAASNSESDKRDIFVPWDYLDFIKTFSWDEFGRNELPVPNSRGAFRSSANWSSNSLWFGLAWKPRFSMWRFSHSKRTSLSEGDKGKGTVTFPIRIHFACRMCLFMCKGNQFGFVSTLQAKILVQVRKIYLMLRECGAGRSFMLGCSLMELSLLELSLLELSLLELSTLGLTLLELSLLEFSGLEFLAASLLVWSWPLPLVCYPRKRYLHIHTKIRCFVVSGLYETCSQVVLAELKRGTFFIFVVKTSWFSRSLKYKAGKG